ncbi:hypothetical protein HMPREF3203_03387 [Proteus mirabilis]|nr:hypothetical protein HMPREF3203_03387 [Proteus mirabilis]
MLKSAFLSAEVVSKEVVFTLYLPPNQFIKKTLLSLHIFPDKRK